MITFADLGKQGNMGNQLFQLSCTIALALRNNDEYVFPPWEFESEFNLHNCFSSNIKYDNTYKESCFEFKEIPYRPNMNLSGFFQSVLYFQDFKQKIKDLLTPVYHFNIESGLCSIHVRRGDYLKFQNCHPVQDMKYYEKAMEISGCKKFLVFSDDINWCKQNFTGNMFDFSEYMRPAVDLAMMAKKCEHNIIANSSFSWWASFLNDNPNKIIIAPKKWFGPGLAHSPKDLITDDWKVI